nr:MAG TPA: hypothetical protein [Microviridae sp.]
MLISVDKVYKSKIRNMVKNQSVSYLYNHFI